MSINKEYFRESVSWDGTADYEPFFAHAPELDFLEAAEGVKLRPMFGKDLMISYVTFAPNSVAPAHQHPQEQMTLVLSGSCEFTVGNLKQVITAGDAVAIPGNVPHSAAALAEGCVCVDVFAPPREAFKELMQKQKGAAK
ncbi:cupin domain-containing protein [Alicyclobacillus mengziensis]|uniref:Cupin domain-containing protein n=1 Tax=Alicyclobacillus mengziensis TaxID=2931921 RepID=A0A9X7VY31_9BACL|nr:cupin domain-containing protein [Alicyclobacillus mengziensis]QSO46885.1 cupin domain-containing protein [Alicyclobacillus mengziensis]